MSLISLISQPAITCSKLKIETLEQRYEICSKLTIKTPKRRHWRRFGVFIVNFEHISHLCSSVSIASFEQVNVGWVIIKTAKNCFLRFDNLNLWGKKTEKKKMKFTFETWNRENSKKVFVTLLLLLFRLLSYEENSFYHENVEGFVILNFCIFKVYYFSKTYTKSSELTLFMTEAVII